MAGRKRHSAEDIVRKLRRADELAAEGKTGEQIAAELGVSAATLYNWRRQFGGMDTDAAKVVWAWDFQFDSTVDGKAVKIASMIDEHTRESLLHLVERSITAEKLVAELEKVFTSRGGPPLVLRMDNGLEMLSQALQQFCANRVGISYIPPGTPWNNGYIESFNRRLRAECLNRNHWSTLLEARVVIGDFKDEHNQRHRHSALGYLTPAEYAARCGHTHHPVACDIN
jgi:transposase InsO family protein